jgi:hypothetical protein
MELLEPEAGATVVVELAGALVVEPEVGATVVVVAGAAVAEPDWLEVAEPEVAEPEP